MGWRDRRPRRPRRLRSKWLPGYWLRHPLSSIVFTGLMTLVVMMLAFYVAYNTYRLNEHGVATTATVLEVHGGSSSYVVARFTTADGQTVVTDVHDYYWSPVPRDGDSATVIYDPDDPANIVRDARIGHDYVGAWLLGLLALIVLGLGLFVIHNWSIWITLAEAWRAR